MLMYQNMMNKKNIKSLLIVVVVLVLLFIFFMPKSYTKKYEINGYKIEEGYNKDKERYSFYIEKEDLKYDFNISSSYLRDKKLIKDIQEYGNDNVKCIVPVFENDKLSTMPLCNKDRENIDYHNSGIQIDGYLKNDNSNIKNINDLEIYNTLNRKYFVWNYHNFIYFDNDRNEEVQVFNSDYYNIDLAVRINEYLVIPNYDSGYQFKEMYVINTNNLKKDTWKLNYEMSVDSYVVGTYKDSIYMIDKKDKIEYELNVKKKEMKIVGTESRGARYYNKKFANVSINKLINENLKFVYDQDQEFVLENKKLYLKTMHTSVLVSNEDIDSIVEKTQDYVYYLIKDTLYYYDIYNGNVKVMKSFEWNFNNNNMIFIY